MMISTSICSSPAPPSFSLPAQTMTVFLALFLLPCPTCKLLPDAGRRSWGPCHIPSVHLWLQSQLHCTDPCELRFPLAVSDLGVLGDSAFFPRTLPCEDSSLSSAWKGEKASAGVAWWYSVKNPVLSLLWHGFDPWPGNFCMSWVQQKKEKKASALSRGSPYQWEPEADG